ncbi:hypothetical protein BBJ28_00012008 [Nothophytophthora sp. Chile5]|nr:hypothetical protein BBJ28_00012008 [Nothophytophthora sp. Chile5]
MQSPYRPALDDAFLEELFLSDSSPSATWGSSPVSRGSPMDAAHKRAGSRAKKKKTPNYPLDAPSTVVRQALFPSGPGSYPSQITPLHQPQGRRPPARQQQIAIDESGAYDYLQSKEHKWREMGWNTSSPAEYLLQSNSKDYKQTLAYYEELQQRQELHAAATAGTSVSIASGAVGLPAKSSIGGGGNFPRSNSFINTTMTATTRGVAEVGSTQSEEERTLLKHVMLREGLLRKLHDLVQAATPPQSLLLPQQPRREPTFDISKGTELLHLLLQLRDAGVMVMQSILRWHELRVRLAPLAPLAPFCFENSNYCSKMASDLNFLSTIKSLGAVLGVNPAMMKQNPFMMPAPIPGRDFQGLRELPWSSLRLFEGEEDPARRVGEAEKYLVWCLINLQEGSVAAASSNSPVHSGASAPSASSLQKLEQQQKLTWQKRAEKQLELLSTPLESLSGPTYVMDSSRMMKRKGFLPSLPQSPPKTLRELMGSVHHARRSGGEESEDYGGNNGNVYLNAEWSGEVFSACAADFEALGARDAPPHHMVTLVAASVLILLSPSDRLPKDLSWRSCQKMLRHGGRLIERIQAFDVTNVPAFKWKALVPFLQNEHFQPNFLSRYSNGSSSLCAWIFAVLRAAQQQDYKRLSLHASSGDADRLVLLSELEVDAGAISQPAAGSPASWETELEDEAQLPSLPRSKSGKRVSIGNAEVLFINENQPVTSTPRAESRPTSRRGESPAAGSKKTSPASSSVRTTKLRLAPHEPADPPRRDLLCAVLPARGAAGGGGASCVLLRTSPWTFHGVTYFVSFFLQEEQQQQQEDEEAKPQEERELRRRLLIKTYEPMSSVESQMFVDAEDLRQDFGEQALAAFRSGEFRSLCDLMLSQLNRMMGAGDRPSTPPLPSEEAEQTVARDLPEATEESDAGDSLSAVEGTGDKQASALDLLLQDSEGEGSDEHSQPSDQVQVRRPDSAEPSHDKEMEASALRIQCAARQQQARQKVLQVRSERQQSETAAPAADGDEGERGSTTAAEDAEAVAARGSARETRPETAMSYASEQFEDECEAGEGEDAA